MLQLLRIAAALCLLPIAASAQHVRQTTVLQTSDSLESSDLGLGNTVAWVSPIQTGKTETLVPNTIVCNSGSDGQTFTIKDEIGTAGTYPITIVPAGSNTIDGQGSFMLNSNFESITVQCDGVSNWLVE